MAPKLVVASGKSAGRTISIKREKLLVGRADECDVRPLSEEVSRRHCAFLPEGDVLFVEDLRSRNGTFVNGTRIEGRHQLADGDLVRIGNLELKVVSREAADAANRDDSRVSADSTSRGDKTAGGRANAVDGSDDEVSRWLMADDDPAGMFDTTRAIRVADDATVPVAAESQPPNPPAEPPKSAEDPEATVVRGRPTTPAGGQKKSGDTSRTAAAEALKKFFGNR